jgi:hypothetical protein
MNDLIFIPSPLITDAENDYLNAISLIKESEW